MLDDIVKYNKIFGIEKKRINEILAKGADFPNDGKVDSGIKDLVYELNTVPFVYSWCSCSGHFVTKEDMIKKYGDEKKLILPRQGYGRFFKGYIGLVFKPSSKTKQCISQIRQVAQNYPNASIDPWSPLIDTDIKELQNLRFEIFFDTPKKGPPRQLPIAQGNEKMSSMNNLISDLYGVFSKYRHS